MMTFKPVAKIGTGLVLGLSIASFALTAGAGSAQAATTSEKSYVTQGDDTFWLVAKKLNIPLQDLLDMNPEISPLNVYPGLTMKLPAASAAKERTMSAESVATPANQVQTLAAPTHAEPSVTTASGEQLAYSKTVSAVATAYSDNPAENGGWGAVDYFGNALKVGTIAVDPKVVPLGTKVYVTGYTYNGLPAGMVCTASDIGGAIKGNRIDMFIPQSAGPVANFGFQNVTLYVLK